MTTPTWNNSYSIPYYFENYLFAEIIQSQDLDLHLDGLASRSGAGKIALEWRDGGVGVFYMPSHKIVTSMHSTGITLLFKCFEVVAIECKLQVTAAPTQSGL